MNCCSRYSHLELLHIRDYKPRIISRVNQETGLLEYYAWTPVWLGPARSTNAEAKADLSLRLKGAIPPVQPRI